MVTLAARLIEKRHSTVHNWARTVHSSPAVVVRPTSQDELLRILKDDDAYPSPVRAMGHFHSTTPCAASDGGTIVDMTALDRIIEIGANHVTVEGGAEYLAVQRALVEKGLHFFVDLQIGNVTLGSLATCDTKDAAWPENFGQLGAYVTHIKLALVSGEVLEVDERNSHLFRAVRSSYGLLGLVLEVTFRVEPMRSVGIRHESYSFEGFVDALPELMTRNGSLMMYFFPFADRVIVQLRRPGDPRSWRNPLVWRLRNLGVAYLIPLVARFTNLVRIATVRYLLQQFFNALSRLILVQFLHARNTRPSEQTTDYPQRSRQLSFTFSIFAFPARDYPEILLAFREFCWSYYNVTSYRPDLLSVGYYVRQCDYSLFSYSADGDVLTIDPVASGGPEWDAFAVAFNEFCVARGGKPLFNQTPALTPAQVRRSFGTRVDQFNVVRKQLDPGNRLLNDYFAHLLG